MDHVEFLVLVSIGRIDFGFGIVVVFVGDLQRGEILVAQIKTILEFKLAQGAVKKKTFLGRETDGNEQGTAVIKHGLSARRPLNAEAVQDKVSRTGGFAAVYVAVRCKDGGALFVGLGRGLGGGQQLVHAEGLEPQGSFLLRQGPRTADGKHADDQRQGQQNRNGLP